MLELGLPVNGGEYVNGKQDIYWLRITHDRIDASSGPCDVVEVPLAAVCKTSSTVSQCSFWSRSPGPAEAEAPARCHY